MQRIAITGGVAEGKTTILQMFKARGAATLSSDALAATLLLPGTEVWTQLTETFGQAIQAADGTLSRDALAALAFGDSRLRRRLNQIMHPAVVRALETQLRTLDAPRVFVEVPLLIEVALQGWFDGVIVAQATPALQRQRLLARGIAPARATQVLRAQLPTRCKVPFADWVVRTHRSLTETERQVNRIWRELTESRRVY
ncbi:MAG: dephospho-CoA kinase [Fimbriimonadales bacterium]|nr:dephospho-CoA kinase [Fimbriimonadales bacterium]